VAFSLEGNVFLPAVVSEPQLYYTEVSGESL